MENIKIKTSTQPQDWALTLDEAKEHLNILDSSFDYLINGYIAAAHRSLVSETNILISGLITANLREFKDFVIEYGEVDTVVIRYYNIAGTLTTLSTDDYRVINSTYTTIEILKTYNLEERLFPIEIEITTLGNVNELVKQALRMIVGDYFENRQSDAAGSFANLSRNTNFQLNLISLKTFN